jgi:hypothetical protein
MLKFVLGFRQALDVPGGIFQGDELPAAGQGDWIVERSRSAGISRLGASMAVG